MVFLFVQTSWKSFADEWIVPKKYSMPVIDGAIDWFVFRRGAYDAVLPPFKLGRYVWDSWMVDYATRSDWNSVTTFSYDRGDQIAFGLHWEVAREVVFSLLMTKSSILASIRLRLSRARATATPTFASLVSLEAD